MHPMICFLFAAALLYLAGCGGGGSDTPVPAPLPGQSVTRDSAPAYSHDALALAALIAVGATQDR